MSPEFSIFLHAIIYTYTCIFLKRIDGNMWLFYNLCLTLYIFLKIFLNIYLFWERQSMSSGGAEREEDTESKAGSRLRAASTEPNTGLELRNHEVMTWPEVRCLTNWVTRAPQLIHLENFYIIKWSSTRWIYVCTII